MARYTREQKRATVSASTLPGRPSSSSPAFLIVIESRSISPAGLAVEMPLGRAASRVFLRHHHTLRAQKNVRHVASIASLTMRSILSNTNRQRKEYGACAVCRYANVVIYNKSKRISPSIRLRKQSIPWMTAFDVPHFTYIPTPDDIIHEAVNHE